MTLVSKTPAPARGAQAPFVSAPATASSAPELQATAPARAFDPDQRRKGLWRMAVLGALAVVFAVLLLVYDNPMEVGSDGFWRILQMRATTVGTIDRKSTRLNSSHVASSYAVFCLNKK